MTLIRVVMRPRQRGKSRTPRANPFIKPTLLLTAFLAGLILGMSGLGRADWSRGWTADDTKRALADTALTAADWAQTRGIVAEPDEYYETSPILGRSPSMKRVDTHFPVMMIVKPVIAWLLPPGDVREMFQYIAIGVELGAVTHNASIGVQMNFK